MNFFNIYISLILLLFNIFYFLYAKRKEFFFIYRNIGVLCGMLLSLGGVNKTFVIWLELSSVIVRDHFVSVSIFFE